MSDRKRTPGPWRWRRIGGEMHLVRDFGARDVVLTRIGVCKPERGGARSVLGVGEGSPRVLVPLTPDHPDAALIEAAPDLLEACAEGLRCLEVAVRHGLEQFPADVREQIVGTHSACVRMRRAIALALGDRDDSILAGMPAAAG